MWPLSRVSTPKQFEKIIGDKSTLQLTVDRVLPEVQFQDIYISSGQKYRHIIADQLPNIPSQNIIGEPEMRDVAPAVGYLMAILAKQDPYGPVAILWSDHLVNHVDRFKNVISAGAEYIKDHPEVFVFIGQKPRFPNQNLGWIEYGKELTTLKGNSLREFISWHYRPDQKKADQYFTSGKHAWNPGYFIVAPQFVMDQFQKHAPQMYTGLKQLQDSYGTPEHETQLQDIYPKFEKIHFDNAILEKVPPQQAVVISVDLGWSDIGTWEALKEAMQKNPNDNLVKGKQAVLNSKNSVIYNYGKQLVSAIDLDGMIVVVTDDVVFVAPQESIPKVKELLKTFDGTELEKYR